MPTIQQLPLADVTDASDEIPVSQGGTTRSVSIGTLLSGTQPAILAPSGVILGRNSIGAGGPEPIIVGAGLTLNQGTLSSSGTTAAAQSGTIAAEDLVYINQGGTIHTISFADFLSGETIDFAQPAAAATDTDTLWVAQGSSTMLRQTFAALWNWIAAKSPSYRLPVVELGADTTLDGTVHNGRILICTRPLTLTPVFMNMGSGFTCDIINLSGGSVVFASGIVTSSASSVLPPGGSASLWAATYSGGNIVFASVTGSSSSAAPIAPGQVTNLSTASITTTSITLSWTPPATGGAPSSYTVQYRITGTSTWTTATSSAIQTSYAINGLTPGTSYDFEAFAVNGGGPGPVSANVTASTNAPAASVVSIGWNVVPSGSFSSGGGSIGVNAHINPPSAPVQFGFSQSATIAPNSWMAASHVNSDLWGTFIPTPATAGTWFVWCEGTDGSLATAFTTGFTVT